LESILARLFYRSIKVSGPMLDNFKSYAALGKQPRQTDPEFLERWNGVSVYDTHRQARKNAQAVNWRIGTYIAELHLPDDAPVICKGPGPTGHWDLHDADPGICRGVSFAWCTRRRLLTCDDRLGVSTVVESRYRETTMPICYEVWDYETGNQINSFETEEAALAFLRRLLTLNGPEGVRELAIVRQTPASTGEYEPTLIFEGTELLAGETSSSSQRAGGSPGRHEPRTSEPAPPKRAAG
jgi:hypothetical protein